MACGAVVVAAGRSQRMGFNKTLLSLAGIPVVARVLDIVGSVPEISSIVVVTNSDDLIHVRALVTSSSPERTVSVCLGGETRQRSVRNGFDALPTDVDLVLVHDAARPLVTRDLIRTGIAEAQRFGAAIAAVPVTDTIKIVGADQTIIRSLNRSQLYAAQTPQIFRRAWLAAAYERLEQQGTKHVFTDESGLLEWAGYQVRVYAGSTENIKLTTPVDLVAAEAILTQREQAAR